MVLQRHIHVDCSTWRETCGMVAARRALQCTINRSVNTRHLCWPCRPTIQTAARCTASRAAADQPYSPQLWDVVQYSLSKDDSSTLLALGVVQQTSAETLQVSRLYEESPGVWLVHDHSGDTETVPVSAVQGVLEADYTQRVDPDRISNPHGEHAEEVWTVPLNSVPPTVWRGT